MAANVTARGQMWASPPGSCDRTGFTCPWVKRPRVRVPRFEARQNGAGLLPPVRGAPISTNGECSGAEPARNLLSFSETPARSVPPSGDAEASAGLHPRSGVPRSPLAVFARSKRTGEGPCAGACRGGQDVVGSHAIDSGFRCSWDGQARETLVASTAGGSENGEVGPGRAAPRSARAGLLPGGRPAASQRVERGDR